MTDNFKSIFSKEQIMIILKNDTKKKADNNKNKSKTNSPYGQMLRESKKISLFYGNLSKKYLQKIFYKSCNQPSKVSENIFSILESRLDVILYRSGFFESIASAKQMIRIGGIIVNNKKIISSSYLVIPGDIISIFGEKNKKKLLPITEGVARSACQLPLSLPKATVFTSGDATAFPLSPSVKGDATKKNQLITTSTNQKLVSMSSTPQKKKLGSWRFKGSPSLLSLISKSCKACIAFSKIRTTRVESKINTASLVVNSGKTTNKTNFYLSKIELAQFRKPLFLINNVKNCLTLNHSEKKALSMPVFAFAEGNDNGNEEKFSNFSFLDSIAKFTKNTIYNIENRFFYWLSKINVSIKSNSNNPLKDFFIDFKEAAKNKTQKDKNDFPTYFVFLNYLLNLKKQYLSIQKKKINYKRQQHLLLFKNQNFFDLKKTKPLHLEISYRSLSIIFLFPPQRITFPFFVNPSLIYK